MDWSLLGSSNRFGTGGHLWIVRRRVCINSKCVAHAEASRPKGSPGQEDCSSRATVFHREQLYSDFISESARAMVDAMQHTLEDLSRLTPVYALISRIRLSSPTKVVESAERVAKTILSTYSATNLTTEEIQSGVGKRDDPLREFSNICRRELESLRGVL
jgi:hypothetical protein